jgi:hypothetical protein
LVVEGNWFNIVIMEKKPPPKPQDIILLHGRTEDGEGYRAIRSREERLELSELRPLREGKPLGSAEVIRLVPREESPILWDVEVQYCGKEGSSGQIDGNRENHAGPARVTGESYRRNWENIFGEVTGGSRGKPTLN